MIHSVLAVLAGFVVMAGIVMIGTVLAVRFVLRTPVSAIRTRALGVLTPAYLAANVTASSIAALVGGYTTATAAGHDRIAHGLGLAALMVAMGVVSARQSASVQPRWYRVVIATVMPALAIGGAALCSVVTAPH